MADEASGRPFPQCASAVPCEGDATMSHLAKRLARSAFAHPPHPSSAFRTPRCSAWGAAGVAMILCSSVLGSSLDVREPARLVVCAGQADGTPCDDGDCCTLGDACSAGVCVGVLMICDDANPCTNEFCDPAGCVCVHVAIPGCTPCFGPEGSACDDGTLCTTGDVCLGGVCTGTDRDCDDSNPCTTDTCDPATGWCAYAPGNSACSDGNPCTTDDHCGTICGEYAEGCGIGSCVGGGYCDGCLCTEPCGPAPPGPPGNSSCACCFASSCGEVIPGCGLGRCLEGSYCDECQCYSPGSAYSQACCSAAACIGTAPKDCRDDNVCTVDTCDPGTVDGCVHLSRSFLNAPPA